MCMRITQPGGAPPQPPLASAITLASATISGSISKGRASCRHRSPKVLQGRPPTAGSPKSAAVVPKTERGRFLSGRAGRRAENHREEARKTGTSTAHLGAKMPRNSERTCNPFLPLRGSPAAET